MVMLMHTISPMYIGVDPTGGSNPFTYAIVDQDCKIWELGTGELYDIIAYTKAPKVTIAVNAPSNTNIGVVRDKIGKKTSKITDHARGLDMRLAEYLLRERGIQISPTPAKREYCSAWMQAGFLVFEELAKNGYKPFQALKADHRWLETHPHATFCAMLEGVPLSKPTLEGRLQRQLILHAHILGIKDPMDFFEEITRHRLLGGNLPKEFIYSPEELDALSAAYVAYLAGEQQDDVIAIGDQYEGQIVLPCSKILDHYN